RSAYQPAAFSAESLDCGRGIHIGQRGDAMPFLVGQTHGDELFPAAFYLSDLSHISHGAAGIEIGQDYLLAGMGENVGAFRHEVHAAKNNELRSSASGLLGKLVRVAAKIREANHFIALVVMAEDYYLGTQFAAGGGNARIHAAIGQDKIILKRTTYTAFFNGRH